MSLYPEPFLHLKILSSVEAIRTSNKLSEQPSRIGLMTSGYLDPLKWKWKWF